MESTEKLIEKLKNENKSGILHCTLSMMKNWINYPFNGIDPSIIEDHKHKGKFAIVDEETYKNCVPFVVEFYHIGHSPLDKMGTAVHYGFCDDNIYFITDFEVIYKLCWDGTLYHIYTTQVPSMENRDEDLHYNFEEWVNNIPSRYVENMELPQWQ